MSLSRLSPSAGLYLPVTSKDLENMKKNVLKQAYQIHLRTQRKITANPELQINRLPEKQPQNSLKSSKSISFLPSYQKPSKQTSTSKNVLKSSIQDFQTNPGSKPQKKSNDLIQHNEMLSFLQNYQNRQAQKKQRQKQEYKSFLQQQIARKNQLSKNRRSEEKEMESVRANRRLGLMNKQRSFKEYFSSVNKYRDSCSLQYISYHQQIKKREKAKDQLQKQALLHQSQLMKEQIRAERILNSQKKQKLRNELQHQISQSRNMKADELSNFKNRGYVKREIDIYNPITNPIDYKIDVNNRYLLNQLFKGNQAKLSTYAAAEK